MYHNSTPTWPTRSKEYPSNELDQTTQYTILNQKAFYEHNIPKQEYYVYLI